MSDNNEYFPIYNPVRKPNTLIDSVIGNSNNIIEPSAINTFVTGEGNYVGENCEDVVIINSSGCVVEPGLKMVTIINSSGSIAYASGEIIIRNTYLSSGTITSGGFYSTTATSYTLGSNNEDVTECRSASSGTIYFLQPPLGNNNKYTLKNMSAYDVELWTYGYTIDDTTSGGAGKVTLSPLDSVTVVADGVSNYIII